MPWGIQEEQRSGEGFPVDAAMGKEQIGKDKETSIVGVFEEKPG